MKKPLSAAKFNQYRTMKQRRVMAADSQTVKIDLDLTVLEEIANEAVDNERVV